MIYLVSIKQKNVNNAPETTLVNSDDIKLFIQDNLSDDNIIIIDAVKTYNRDEK